MNISCSEFSQANFTVLQNSSKVAPYIDEHMNIIQSENPQKNLAWITRPSLSSRAARSAQPGCPCRLEVLPCTGYFCFNNLAPGFSSSLWVSVFTILVSCSRQGNLLHAWHGSARRPGTCRVIVGEVN